MNELRLEWKTGSHTHTSTISAGTRVTIGRQPDSTIIIDQPAVSRQHATIMSAAGNFYLRNLSRTNNIPVNNQFRLAGAQTVRLHPGDIFRIGPVVLRVAAITTTEARPPRIKCINCDNLLDYQPEGFCPYCGTALAEGHTVVTLPDVPGIQALI